MRSTALCVFLAAALAFLCLPAAIGVAQPSPAPAPTPPGPVNPAASLALPSAVAGDPGDFITVPATTNCATVKWLVMDKGLKQFPIDLLKDTRTGVFVGQTPGNYRVAAFTSNATGPSDPQICLVTVNGATPAPIPGPGPAPPAPAPTPTPTAANVWVMAIYDDTAIANTPGLSGILTDDSLWAGIKSGGHDWQKFTVKDPRYATYKPILDSAKVSVPALVLLTKTGAASEKVLQAVAMPPDSASVSKLIKSVTGK